jgi:hypothetical protein
MTNIHCKISTLLLLASLLGAPTHAGWEDVDTEAQALLQDILLRIKTITYGLTDKQKAGMSAISTHHLSDLANKDEDALSAAFEKAILAALQINATDEQILYLLLGAKRSIYEKMAILEAAHSILSKHKKYESLFFKIETFINLSLKIFTLPDPQSDEPLGIDDPEIIKDILQRINDTLHKYEGIDARKKAQARPQKVHWKITKEFIPRLSRIDEGSDHEE